MNDRTTQITALCQTARMPEKAQGYIDSSKTPSEVLAELFTLACQDRWYRAEYAANRESYRAVNMTEEAYVESRRIDDRLDTIGPGHARISLAGPIG